jgi:hypothetical protein
VISLSLSLSDYFIFGLSTPIVPSHILVAVLLSLFGERNIFDDVDDSFQTNCEAQEDQTEESAGQWHHRQ